MPDVIDASTNEANESAIRDRAIRLYTFLKEYVQLRGRSALRVEEYARDGSVVWLADIPDMPGCHCAAQQPSARDPEVWLEVRKPRFDAVPTPPLHLEDWLDAETLSDSSREEPQLEDAILGPDGHWLTLAERPDVQSQYRDYIEGQWRPWAQHDQLLRRQQDVYAELFRIHQQQQRLGEAYEVVMALGLFTWETPSGQRVRRHLIVNQTDVRFDAVRGVMTVCAAADGARPTLEEDMLEPEHRPSRTQVDRIASMLADVGDDIFVDASLGDALQAWAHSVSAHATCGSQLEPQREETTQPRVRLAPALILRKRADRSIVQALDSIVAQLSEGGPIPDTVRQLVGTANRTAQDSDLEDILFPLPANEQQIEVVRRLRDRPGVLVQGPPGTGKSHTTANLIAHLLAGGKRVLVTSHTARALAVLREKIPADIRELAVVVLGNDLTGRQELNASVRGISQRYASWDTRDAAVRIKRARQTRNRALATETSVIERLRTIREHDCFSHPPRAGGYAGTLQQIALQLSGRAPEFAWTREVVDPAQDCPLSDREANELLELLENRDRRVEEELQMTFPPSSDLPRPDEFRDAVAAERQAAAASDELARYRDHAAYRPLLDAGAPSRHDLWRAAYAFWQGRAHLHGHTEPWVRTAVSQVLSARAGRWRELERTTRQTLQRVREALERAAVTLVEGLDGRDLSAVAADARALLDHLRRGGSLRTGMFASGIAKRTSYIAQDVRLDGYPCRDEAAVMRLIGWIDAQIALSGLDAEWREVTTVPTGSLRARVAEYDDLLRTLHAVLDFGDLHGTLSSAAASVRGMPAARWDDDEWLKSVFHVLDLTERDTALGEAEARFTNARSSLGAAHVGNTPHPVTGMLDNALETRNVDRYDLAFRAVLRLEERRAAVERRDHLLRRLEEASPALRTRLAETADLSAWRPSLAQLESAWAWRQADAWVGQMTDPGALVRLEHESDAARREVESATRRLAGEQAWAHCLERLSDDERKHLMAWENAVRRLGKGTGKYATHWRRQAQTAMAGCRSAVPAWIMPIFKVAETIGVAPEAFDVVIVDEASQSGPEALFLHYLAKKVIVVGDDQQISPDNAGLDRSRVRFLIEQRLRDVPLANTFDADNSLFDLTQIHFRDRLALREHFRCVPEIIQFSNELCYADERLIPLKQFGEDRLLPAVETRRVAEGATTDDNVNDAEAQAIVDQLTACLRDPEYADKTFGVISLVGDRQARHIERLLANRVGPEEMARRRVVCGDAYAFQGDERDVMFLSLVQAPSPTRRLGTLSGEADKRRFNVAASRAREQMWLFHSVTPDELNPVSMAHRLLTYCSKPHTEPSPLDDATLEELRVRASDPERSEVPPPFESWLEADVFSRVAERGFRVVPNYDLSGYRIDLLVEGARSRLAVECEDDRRVDVERFEQLVRQQRMLERCGTRFCRVRGPAFYRDPEAALQGLWDALRSTGIGPEAAPTRMDEPSGPDSAVGAPAKTEEAPQEPEGAVAGFEPEEPVALPSPPDEMSGSAGATPDEWEVTGRPPAEPSPAGPAIEEEAVQPVPPPAPAGGVEDQLVPYPVAQLAQHREVLEWSEPGAVAHLRRMALEVIEVEAPIHRELLLERVREAWGKHRAGRRMSEVFGRVLQRLADAGEVELRGEFLWKVGRRLPGIRVPAGDPRGERQVSHVTPEELDRAVGLIAKQGTMSEDDLTARAAALFGWRRRGPDIAAALGGAVRRLLSDGLLQRRDAELVWSGPKTTIGAPAPSSGAEAPVSTEDQRVRIGRRVWLRTDDGEEWTYVLVNPSQESIALRRLSVATPLGIAIHGRRVGDRVGVYPHHGETYQVEIVRVEDR